MKKFLEMILERASEFINYKKDTQEIEEDNANILQTQLLKSLLLANQL